MTSLRVGGLILLACAFVAGGAAVGLWVLSDARWQAHLDRAERVGALLHAAITTQGTMPPGLVATTLPDLEAALADKGQFERLPDAPRPAFVTQLTLLADSGATGRGAPLALAIVSPELRYPLAGLTRRAEQPQAETLSILSRQLGTYCSEPVLYARRGEAPWLRIAGPGVWDCASHPADLRGPAAIGAAIALAVLATLILNTAGQFSDFAQALANRRRVGGADSYDSTGPQELRDIVAAVNASLDLERDMLARRALVLSGVSHDLGTPATRLRLRAALIEDADLRARFDADIDRMTGIIESVLTYTRAELDAEPPRQVSLTSLVEAVVDDYRDLGSPVSLRETAPITVQGGPSLFMSRRGHGAVPEERKVIVTARPVVLTRALTNLVDNALKYGRRATVWLETSSEWVVIRVEDEGGDTSAEEMEALTAPFLRGAGAGAVDGYGMGLTIASTVAALHGGELSFEQGARGLIARLRLRRA